MNIGSNPYTSQVSTADLIPKKKEINLNSDQASGSQQEIQSHGSSNLNNHEIIDGSQKLASKAFSSKENLVQARAKMEVVQSYGQDIFEEMNPPFQEESACERMQQKLENIVNIKKLGTIVLSPSISDDIAQESGQVLSKEDNTDTDIGTDTDQNNSTTENTQDSSFDTDVGDDFNMDMLENDMDADQITPAADISNIEDGIEVDQAASSIQTVQDSSSDIDVGDDFNMDMLESDMDADQITPSLNAELEDVLVFNKKGNVIQANDLSSKNIGHVKREEESVVKKNDSNKDNLPVSDLMVPKLSKREIANISIRVKNEDTKQASADKEKNIEDYNFYIISNESLAKLKAGEESDLVLTPANRDMLNDAAKINKLANEAILVKARVNAAGGLDIQHVSDSDENPLEKYRGRIKAVVIDHPYGRKIFQIEDVKFSKVTIGEVIADILKKDKPIKNDDKNSRVEENPKQSAETSYAASYSREINKKHHIQLEDSNFRQAKAQNAYKFICELIVFDQRKLADYRKEIAEEEQIRNKLDVEKRHIQTDDRRHTQSEKMKLQKDVQDGVLVHESSRKALMNRHIIKKELIRDHRTESVVEQYFIDHTKEGIGPSVLDSR